MKRIIVAVAALSSLLSAGPAAAASREAAALRRDLGPSVRVAEHRETGKVRFIGTAAGRPIARPRGVRATASPRVAARAFLARHGKAFGLAEPAQELRVESSHGGSAGRSSVRFQQLRDGIPVMGGELVVNLDRGGNVLSAGGETAPAAATRTPSVTAAAARQEAIAAVAKERRISAVRLRSTSPSLWIYDARLLGGPGPQRPTLVWRLEIKGQSGLPVDDLVLVDAARGHVALRIEQIEQFKDRRVCDAGNTSGAGGAYPCSAPVATETDLPGAGDDADVLAAFDFAGDTYDFYFDRFGRDSLDGNGLPLRSTIDYCDPSSACPFANAFWDGQQMAYGDGFAAADDVVGHELTHGVTDFSAHLFYYYQSGAINESLSDVFGEFVDLTNGEGTDTAGVRWQIGEDLPASFGVLRDMEDPSAAPFNDPDSMTSPLYFGGEADSGGVHTNSGVNNKAAFLITDGGGSVTGLGITKAARIYYEVQTAFLTSGSDYADLASALPQACTDLIGTEGITAADCTEVGDAVAAVQMSADPPNAPAPHAPAAACPSGQVRTDQFRDDLESSAGWVTDDANRWGIDDTFAHSGEFSLFGADSGTASNTYANMVTNIAVPADAVSAYLRFDHSYGFEDSSGGVTFDGGVLEVSTNGGATYSDIGALLTDVGYDGTITSASNPLNGRPAFVGESNGYRASRATLTSLKGQSVRFRFRIGTDASVGGAGWSIDDVHIYSCAAPPDADGDGVPDASDACPTTAAATPNGCPAVAPGGGGTPGGGTTAGDATPVAGTPAGSTPAPTAPRLRAVRVSSCKLAGRGKNARVRCTLRSFRAVRRASVTVKLRGRTVASKSVRPTSKGVLSLKPLRTLRRGTYKVTITLRDAQGRTSTRSTTLRVR